MSATLAFAGRCRRELTRDPLSLIFGVALPLVLLALMSLLGQNLPVNPFPVEAFAPGMAVFAQTFLMLFSGLLLATDRTTAFLTRTFASPMPAGGYLAAYALPLLPLGLAQGAVCLAAALTFGLAPSACSSARSAPTASSGESRRSSSRSPPCSAASGSTSTSSGARSANSRACSPSATLSRPSPMPSPATARTPPATAPSPSPTPPSSAAPPPSSSPTAPEAASDGTSSAQKRECRIR